MGEMAKIHQEILDMLEQGDRPIKIATLLDIPVSMVYDVLEEQEQTANYSPFQTVNS
jgi:hypothetical protein